MRLFNTAVSILLFFFTFCAFAWNGADHQLMVKEASLHLPFEMSLLFDHTAKYEKQLNAGAVKPDRVFHDYRNHVWHVKPDKKGRHFGGAPQKIAAEIQTICQMFANKADLSIIAEEMAVASHYLADINNPLHTDSIPFEKKIHQRFERNFEKYGDKNWQFDGFDFYPLIPAWVKKTALRSHQYYQNILDAYKGNGFSQVKKISNNCYEEGVNDIIDLFYNIYLRCGSQLYQYSEVKNSGYKINLNSANTQQLAQLYYIDKRLARRLIRYRERHGAFTNIEETKKVKGFSKKRFNKIKNFLTIKAQ